MIKLWLRFVEEEGVTLAKPPQVNSLAHNGKANKGFLQLLI